MARKAQVSAGLLVFRRRGKLLEILLAHPGGPYWAKKDEGAWSIPKGLVESDNLLRCAQREFAEETGLAVDGPFAALPAVKQKSGKVVHAFAVEADLALDGFTSTTFDLEWPPKSGRRQAFPEVDRVHYFDAETALAKIIAYQRPLIVALMGRIEPRPGCPEATA